MSVMEDTNQMSDRENRAVMLETQTPAYARSPEARRALDEMYQGAKKLSLITGMRHIVQSIVPMKSISPSVTRKRKTFSNAPERFRAAHIVSASEGKSGKARR